MAWRSESPYYSTSYPTPHRAYENPRAWKHCASCGGKLKSVHKFCPKCGMKTGEMQTLDDLRPKSCTQCQVSLESGALYCHCCGEAVDQNWLALRTCTCKAVLPEQAHHCVKCGKAQELAPALG